MNRKQTARIKLEKDEEAKATEDIVKYFADERNEHIGNLEAILLLEFILDKIGPAVYNRAILDVQKYMDEKLEDLYGLML
jgi:uncharacterized protein (DUF2164 family)